MGASLLISSPNNWQMLESTKPVITFEEILWADVMASVFARIVPQSQNACLYSLDWYFMEFLENTSVKIKITGDWLTDGSSAVAFDTNFLKSPRRMVSSFMFLGSKWYTQAPSPGRSEHTR